MLSAAENVKLRIFVVTVAQVVEQLIHMLKYSWARY